MRVMAIRLIIGFGFFCMILSMAPAPAQAQNISRHVRMSLGSYSIRVPKGWISKRALIDIIEKASSFGIYYKMNTIDPDQRVYSQGGTKSLPEAMEMLLWPDTTLYWNFVPESRSISINRYPSKKGAASSLDRKQMIGLKVRVKDEDNEPVCNATLTVVRTKQQISTGEDGEATVNSCQDGDSIYCTHVDKKPEQIPVTESYPLEIVLKNRDPLSEAIVTGYTFSGERVKTSISDRLRIKTDMDYQPVSNIQGALEGKFAGLLVTQSSGVFGAMYDISLRGNMSMLNGHTPLFIIDGVPIASGGQSMSNVITGNSAGGALNPLSFLSKDMIGSVEVLKDADATAIYGSKGANGVILITTKRPAPGKLQLEMGVETGFNLLGRQPRIMDVRTYTAMRREAFANDGQPLTVVQAPDLMKWDTTRNTNWQKYLLGGTAATTRAHAFLSGGNDRNQYLLGAGGLTENNVFITHPNHRLLTLTGKWDHTSDSRRLRMSTALIGGWDENHQFTSDITRLQFLAPNAPDLLVDGKPVHQDSVNFKNPWRDIGNAYTAKSHHYLFNEDIRYRLSSHFLLKFKGGYNEIKTGEFSVNPIWTQKNPQDARGNSFYANTTFAGWILEPQIQYTLVRNDWKIGVLGGGSWQGLRSAVTLQSDSGFTSDAQISQPWMARKVTDSSSPGTDYHYEALFTRVNINWKDRRILNFSARRDRSSMFEAAKQYGIFWAAGAGWIFSEEPFFKKGPDFISFGKLRGSLGITGNDLIGGGSRYINRTSPTSGLSFQNIPGFLPMWSLNPDISWETIKKAEISMDLGFRNNRQLLTVSWYRHRSGNQLLPDSFTDTARPIRLHNQPVVLQNSGWEFTLSSKNISSKQFEWTTSVNLSLPVSKLVAYPRSDPSRYPGLAIGQSLQTVQGPRYTGLDANGVYKFQDVNKDGVFDERDITTLGKLDVTCFGGIENNFRLGSWRLSIFLEGRAQTGVDYEAAIFTNAPPGALSPGILTNQTTDMLNRWKSTTEPGDYQRLSMKKGTDANNAIPVFVSSSGVLVNASYVRLKTMSLYYNWAEPWCRKIGVRSGAFFFKTENLMTLTPYKGADPETQSVIILPPLKTIVAGMEIRF